MKFERFEDIVAWQKGKDLAVNIYKAFELSRDYGFNDQIQRAAVSISNNIAEGFERRSNTEFKNFLFYSKGSCGEVRSMLYIAKDLEKITPSQFSSFMEECTIISKMLSNLIKTL